MSKKRVWIINQYASLPSTGIGGRHRDLSRELVKLGYEVTLVASRWTHLVRDAVVAGCAPESEVFEGFRFLRLPSSQYEHAHDKRRIWNWFVFAFQVRQLDKRLGQKPDIIVYSSPSLIGYLGAYRLARRCGAKLIFEVRDIWPLTFMEVGGYTRRHPFIRFLQWIENFAYRTADHTTSNLEGAGSHMRERGLPASRFSWIPNGFSLEELRQVEALPEEVASRIPRHGFRIVYAGTMGTANALESLVAAAKLLLDKGANIHFVLVGNGRSKPDLEAQAKAARLGNIVFLDAVSRTQVQSVLQRCDACFIGWKDSSLYDHGIAANKLFDYLYSGKPILHAFSGRFDPVASYGAGITVPAENSEAIAGGALQLSYMSEEELQAMGESGRQAAINCHEYAVLAKKYDDLFNQLLRGRGH
ncbi:glycosyltransferase family 4 protein [Marinobacter nauticus]|uniref:glycosyltransferase family 4 protein n=1 Tax=Marinobacter nauticus TaxID=2743 RepID=UPI001CFE62F6|nr:glycosyltransferase family 4 protein [Marinobacter nauticus]